MVVNRKGIITRHLDERVVYWIKSRLALVDLEREWRKMRHASANPANLNDLIRIGQRKMTSFKVFSSFVNLSFWLQECGAADSLGTVN